MLPADGLKTDNQFAASLGLAGLVINEASQRFVGKRSRENPDGKSLLQVPKPHIIQGNLETKRSTRRTPETPCGP